VKKIIIVGYLLIFFLSYKKSAEEEIEVCGVSNPIINLTWLNQKYKLFTGSSQLNSIVLYEYNGSQILQVNQSVSSKMYDIYQCDGDPLIFDDANGLNHFLSNRKKIAVLYGT
jgi:hypothetical protein